MKWMSREWKKWMESDKPDSYNINIKGKPRKVK